MRVGLIIYGSLETVSGGYLYDKQLVNYLTNEGDDVDIVSLPPGTYAEHLQDNFSADLRKRLQTADYDILLQDELNHPSLFLLNGRLSKRYPIVAITHHLRVHEQHPAYKMPFYRWVERTYLNSVDGFICNSQTTRQSIEALVRETRPHIISSPAGNRFADAPPRPAQERESSRLRILFVGNVIPRKGLDTLLTALAYLDRDRFELHVVGNQDVDPAYMRLIDQLIAEFHLENNVTVTGTVSDDDLMVQYQWADVLVVPSTYEGFGIVYMEAMRFGVPAIGSTAGAAKEIITHRQNGFLVDPGDIHAISGHLKQLYMDRGLLARISDAARRRYDLHPSWTASMSRIRTFMQRIVATKGLPNDGNRSKPTRPLPKRRINQHL